MLGANLGYFYTEKFPLCNSRSLSFLVDRLVEILEKSLLMICLSLNKLYIIPESALSEVGNHRYSPTNVFPQIGGSGGDGIRN